MDIVIPFRHSAHEDEELRYVLRSIDRHFAAAGKVWILGDRPEWLTANRRVAEHVPHEQVSQPFRFRTPVRSYFLLTFLGSVIPELSAEYVQAMDDSVLLSPVDADFLRRPRAIGDLSQSQTRAPRFASPCTGFSTRPKLRILKFLEFSSLNDCIFAATR